MKQRSDQFSAKALVYLTVILFVHDNKTLPVLTLRIDPISGVSSERSHWNWLNQAPKIQIPLSAPDETPRSIYIALRQSCGISVHQRISTDITISIDPAGQP